LNALTHILSKIPYEEPKRAKVEPPKRRCAQAAGANWKDPPSELAVLRTPPPYGAPDKDLYTPGSNLNLVDLKPRLMRVG
jgi:alpha-ketoglutarate-dependent taurine dioxygenase